MAFGEATSEWPESYAILTIDAAPHILPLNDRQAAVVKPELQSAWATLTVLPLC